MKEKIKEINDYFVQKIVNKEYDFISMNDFFYCLSIDGYRFDIWIANGVNNVSTDVSVHNSFMTLDFTEEQKKVIYDNIIPSINDKTKSNKLEQYNKLKEELGL